MLLKCLQGRHQLTQGFAVLEIEFPRQVRLAGVIGQGLLDQRCKGCQWRLQLLHRQARRIGQRLRLQGRHTFTQLAQVSLHLGRQLGMSAFTTMDKQISTGAKHLYLRQLHLSQRHIRRGMHDCAEKNQRQTQQAIRVGAAHRASIHSKERRRL